MRLRQVLKQVPLLQKSFRSFKKYKNDHTHSTALLNVKLEQYLTSIKTGKIKQKQITKPIFNRPISYEEMQCFQVMIDSLSYPPNHSYTLQPFAPVGDTKIRLEKIKLLDSEFFTGHNFLDIGCNKGFFSLTALSTFETVTSIDNDNRFTDLLKSFDIELNVVNKSFRNFTTDQTFDKIMIGNVAHYLYNESGWDWIAKLAVLSTGKVLIEGAIDMKCDDMKIAIPKEKQAKFNEFQKEIKKYFRLVTATSSISPDRYVMLYERKHNQFMNVIHYKKMNVKSVIKNDEHQMVLDLGDEVAKINKMKESQWFPIIKNNINMARLSPISNGVTGIIEKKGVFVGWTEKKTHIKINPYKEEQEKIFKQICRHQQFLARNGYVDCDCATINFFVDGTLFDKSMVIPISEMQNKIIDYYITYLNQSFDLELLVQEKIIYALKSKDSVVLESTFRQLGDMKWN